MNVQDTLKSSLLTYPSIFPNKWSVYHHMFAVNGNGCEWINGELVDSSLDYVGTVKDAIELLYKKEVESINILNTPLNFIFERLKEGTMLALDLENRMVDFTQTNKELYPLCKYAKILNIPDDIQPDWLEAAKEFYDYLLDSYSTFSLSDQKFIDEITFL
jgi:hypothetical protein